LRRCPEETVCGHEAPERLVRPLKVVRVDEKHEPPLGVGEVRKHRPRQKFVPQGLPESLDFPECLRVLRPALDVGNPLAPKLLLEFRAPAPRRVLPSLVRQNLPRVAVRRYPAPQGLHHQGRALVVRQRMRHEEARVVVHEADQVEPLVPTQEKREDVRLPKLVGLGSLEAPRAVLVWLSTRPCLGHQALLVEDPPYLCLAHPETLEA
jgi:hypothetical protein